MEEAIEIAKRLGIDIPEDVSLYLDDISDFGDDTFARGPRVDKPPGGMVFWSDLVHDKTGKVPFRLRPDVFKSDEAIVAVIAHEMYELGKFRPLLKAGRLTIEDYIIQSEPGRVGNYHDQAWDEADRFVDRLRGEQV